MEELKLPELGENIESAAVAAVLVAVGDAVRRNQPVIEVETEKASLEVPANADGTVAELLVSAGDTIRVGQTILKIDGSSSSSRESESPAAQPEPEPEPVPPPSSAPETPESAEAPAVVEFRVKSDRGRPQIGPSVPAAPSVRALARELGVEILEVPGSGPAGRISRDDVKAYAKRLIHGAPRTSGTAPIPELPDFSQWGDVERQALSAVRKATAKAMATAWAQVPHVTQFDRADVTQIEAMRRRFNARPDTEQKLTLTAIVVKMAAAALRQFPGFNAALDLAREELLLKQYVHVGVAVDTERGLLVPVIRDADRKSLLQVAREINQLADRARSRKLGPDEMAGACLTVSNLGGLGTTYFTPIVPWPQVAILGVGRAEQQAVFDDGRFHPRLVLPLSVSYDHRVIDGADAARFLRWLAEALEQPFLLLLDE